MCSGSFLNNSLISKNYPAGFENVLCQKYIKAFNTLSKIDISFSVVGFQISLPLKKRVKI